MIGCDMVFADGIGIAPSVEFPEVRSRLDACVDPPSDPAVMNKVEVENSELARLCPPVEGRGDAARLLAAEEFARLRPFG